MILRVLPMLCLIAAASAAAENTVDLCDGAGEPVLRYRYADVPYKPYADRFLTPAGVNILRDAPFDHLHHHAMMYAMKVDGVNFWEERGEAGKQVHLGFGLQPAGEDGGPRLVEQLAWCDHEGTRLLEEERTITVMREEKGPSVATWTSVFSVPEGKAKAELGGNHYHGLGLRFLVSMDKGGRFLYPSEDPGELVRGTEYLTPARWCAYVAEADGKPVTVAGCDLPGNPRPALWFTMTQPFAYLSATVNLWREPIEVTPGAPVTFSYSFALWDGVQEAETVAAWASSVTKAE